MLKKVIVLGLCVFGLTASSQAAVVTLNIAGGGGEWTVTASVGDGCEGLSSFIIDVTGREGLTVDSAQLETPSGVVLGGPVGVGSFGFVEFPAAPGDGVGISAGQPTAHPDVPEWNAWYDSLVLQGVGQVPGSKDDFQANTVSWDAPVVLARGTYTGSVGHLDVDVHTPGFFNLLSTVGSWEGPGNVEEATEVIPGTVYIPEPVTLSILALGGLAILRRRR